MRYSSRPLFIVVLVVILSALFVVPAAAQDEDDPIGGVLAYGTFGAGPDTLNPIYCTGTDCADVINFMHIGLFGVDPATATIEPNQPGALAESWEISDDNLVYTITLREDLFFTDGTQITANDLMYMWEVTNTPEAAYSLAFLASEIEDVVMIDDFTIEVTMTSPSCNALGNISGALTGRGRVIPSHVFSQYSMDVDELANIPYTENPDPTSGVFVFGDYRPAEITTMLRNEDYVDATLGYVGLDGALQLVVPDQTVLLEEFLSANGELNVILNPSPDRISDIRAASEAGTHQMYEFAGNTWDYMAFNLADPNDPQPALDEDGNRVDQGYHPIFTDRLVRQAIGHAVDVGAIIEGAVFGEGTRMSAHITPGSWAVHPDLEPRSYDKDLALELLAEAGWVPGDDGILVCDDCLYAREVDESFNGSPLEFELITNSGNTRREGIGTIIQDELADIGIVVDFRTIEFNTLLDVMDAQTYDTLILGWRAGYPDSPDSQQLFGPDSDVPGSGNNFTSFYNERFNELELEALNMPGCENADRAPIYHEMQEIMYEEMPYLWLYTIGGVYAARSNVQGFDPYPANIYWNVDAWTVQE